MAGLGASLPLLGDTSGSAVSEGDGGGPALLSGGLLVADVVTVSQFAASVERVYGVDQLAVVSGYPLSASDGLTIGSDAAMTMAVAIAQRMLLGDSQATAISTVLAQTLSAADTTNLGSTLSLSDGVSMDVVLSAAAGAVVAEQLGLTANALPNSIYQLTLAQLVRLSDLLGQFASGSLADTVGVSETLGGLYRPLSQLSDTIDVTDTGAPVLLVAASASDGSILADGLDPQSFYDALLNDGVEFTAALVSPAGGVTTWAINTRTGATTEYRNYDFNSFALVGRRYIGASSSGLYELDGNDDDGSDIIAQIKTGLAQFGGTKFTAIKAAYVGVRGGGNFILRVTTGDGTTYDYQITNANNMATTKVHMGKGLRSRYFAFELISAGQDFDLDNIELIPVVFERRV